MASKFREDKEVFCAGCSTFESGVASKSLDLQRNRADSPRMAFVQYYQKLHHFVLPEITTKMTKALDTFMRDHQFMSQYAEFDVQNQGAGLGNTLGHPALFVCRKRTAPSYDFYNLSANERGQILEEYLFSRTCRSEGSLCRCLWFDGP